MPSVGGVRVDDEMSEAEAELRDTFRFVRIVCREADEAIM